MQKINKTFISQIWTFIKKDVRFNYLYAFLSIILVVIFPIALRMDTANPLITLYILAPFISTNLFITKVCYTEDDYLTRIFLNNLPVTKFLRISSRYIMCLCASFILEIICFSVSAILGFDISLEGMLLSLAGLLLYYALYFFLFFKYNYNVAQKTTMIFILLIVGSYLLSFNTNFFSQFNLGIITLIVSLISIILYCLSCNFSCKSNKHDT